MPSSAASRWAATSRSPCTAWRGSAAARASWPTRGPLAVLDAMLPTLVGPAAQQAGAVPAQLKDLTRTNSADGVVDALEALKTRPDARPGLAAVKCPTLVMVGAEDALTPPSAAET